MPLSLRLPRTAAYRDGVAALELLGRRGATSRAGVVLKAAGDLNPTVAKAASDALAGVVTDKDLPALYSLLEGMSSASDANAGCRAACRSRGDEEYAGLGQSRSHRVAHESE